MYRLSIVLFSLMLWLLTGCGKKPVPEPVPSPMTEAYLLKHMRVAPEPKLHRTSIAVLDLARPLTFHDANATLYATLLAQVPAAGTKHDCTRTTYMLLFSFHAGAWGEFTEAIDLFGRRYIVHPYTSYIRQGKFIDNFYLEMPADALRRTAASDTDFLIMNRSDGIDFSLPRVYPAALLHYLESFCRENNASSQRE